MKTAEVLQRTELFTALTGKRDMDLIDMALQQLPLEKDPMAFAAEVGCSAPHRTHAPSTRC